MSRVERENTMVQNGIFLRGLRTFISSFTSNGAKCSGSRLTPAMTFIRFGSNFSMNVHFACAHLRFSNRVMFPFRHFQQFSLLNALSVPSIFRGSLVYRLECSEIIARSYGLFGTNLSIFLPNLCLVIRHLM